MSLDEIDLDNSEIGGNSEEKVGEKSEKQKEASRRAQSQLQKTQKDEKKGKWDNDDLFRILSGFIKNPLYEDLIPSIVLLLQNGFPSRFILATIALVYPEASYYLFEKLKKETKKETILHLHHYKEPFVFNENTLHPSLRDWISLWMMLTQEYLGHEDGSVILQQKTLDLLTGNTKYIAEEVIKNIFLFFLTTKNIILDESKGGHYAEFIVSEYEKVIKKYLENADSDLKSQTEINNNTLFGLG